MSTIAERQSALHLRPLDRATDIREVPKEARFAYQTYLSERRTLLGRYVAALYAVDGRAEAVAMANALRRLDASIKAPVMVFEEPKLAGVGLKAPRASSVACLENASTRASGARHQSYNNCGLEAWRVVINLAREQSGEAPVSEDQLLRVAVTHGWAREATTARESGGSTADGQVGLLRKYGIGAKSVSQSMKVVNEAVSSGRGITVGVNPQKLWPKVYTNGGVHALLIAGVKRDEKGVPTEYVLNDTGQGLCGTSVKASDLEAALIPQAQAVVTEAPVWEPHESDR